jgi:hypothetical protein
VLSGCLSIEDIYAACEEGADIARDNGHEPPDEHHPSDTRWRRRARGALQNLRRCGRARRVGAGTWVLNAPAARATVFLLINADAELRAVELRVGDACDLLGSLAGLDLVLTDPPYALARDSDPERVTHMYARDHSRVVGGYIDVRADAYREFCREWISAAARAMRVGAQLAVITGPQRAAHVQIAAEEHAASRG